MKVKNLWTSTDIRKIFRTDSLFKSMQTLYYAEEKGEIPTASRIPRGKVNVRHWKLDQIPQIGTKFGFLNKPTNQVVLCTYIQKGGVLKTTISFNIAQTLAINGIKTLIIGLDFECSITDILVPQINTTNIDYNSQVLGIFHLLAENAPVHQVIQTTHLPTLDIIPETHDLVVFDKWLNQQQKKQYLFKDKLLPILNQYDVIIFDNGPSWNHLIENAILSSDCIICPLGCNLLSYNATETNIASIFEYKEIMKIKKQKLVMLASLLDRTSLSQQIYAKYLNRYADYILSIPIRQSSKVQDAMLDKKTVLEAFPSSSISDDFFEIITSFWKIIND